MLLGNNQLPYNCEGRRKQALCNVLCLFEGERLKNAVNIASVQSVRCMCKDSTERQFK